MEHSVLTTSLKDGNITYYTSNEGKKVTDLKKSKQTNLNSVLTLEVKSHTSNMNKIAQYSKKYESNNPNRNDLHETLQRNLKKTYSYKEVNKDTNC